MVLIIQQSNLPIKKQTNKTNQPNKTPTEKHREIENYYRK